MSKERMRDSICIFLPFGEKNYGVAAVETGGKQMSTGHLHLMGSNPSPYFLPNKKRHPNGWRFCLAEDEGFEPPQTESESGVLPLHKSSKRNKIIIHNPREKSSTFFKIFQIIFPRGKACPQAPLL